MPKIYSLYAYFLDGKAVYVGHTNNITKRDWAHSHYSSTGNFRIPFHRFMKASGGRKKFTLLVVATVKSEKAAIRLENKLINEYGTWHTRGGYNFLRAVLKFDKKSIHAAWRAALSSAWTNKRKRETSRRMKQNNPSKRADVRESISKSVKKNWKNKELRKSMMRGNLRRSGIPMSQTQRRNLSKHMKSVWAVHRAMGLKGRL